jgi:hypothetical protein
MKKRMLMVTTSGQSKIASAKKMQIRIKYTTRTNARQFMKVYNVSVVCVAAAAIVNDETHG